MCSCQPLKQRTPPVGKVSAMEKNLLLVELIVIEMFTPWVRCVMS